MRRPSAGTRSPAASSTTSPGTRSRPGTVISRPSRTTCSLSATEVFSRSAAASARYSCTVSSIALVSTIAPMMMKLLRSPVSAEIAAAASRISTSGLRKRLRNRSGSETRRRSSRVLGPYRNCRAAASAEPRPSRPVPSCRSRSASPVCQNLVFSALSSISDSCAAAFKSAQIAASKRKPWSVGSQSRVAAFGRIRVGNYSRPGVLGAARHPVVHSEPLNSSSRADTG